MIQRVSDPFDDLVMDSNKSLKSIYKGSRRNGVRMAKRKKGMTFIPYDYEAAYKQYGVRYDLVVALIEKESGYKFDKVGDDGHSIGYMQIYEECHRDRMERLNVTDLTNPYQNVLVGIDYLSELIERYGTIQDALAAYNYGEQGAKQHLWKNGIYVYEYNQTIMSRMKEIEEELERDAGD